MKKRERYKLIYNEEELGYAIIDTEADLSDNIHGWNILCDLLNQQDKEIKKLKKELSKYKSYKTTDERIRGLENLYSDYTKENRQLNEHIKELELLLNADNKMKTNSIKGFEKLKQENLQLKERISIKMEELHIAYCGIEEVKTKNGNLKAEIQQLKQSQKQLAIEKLQEVSNYIENGNSGYYKSPSEIKRHINGLIDGLIRGQSESQQSK